MKCSFSDDLHLYVDLIVPHSIVGRVSGPSLGGYKEYLDAYKHLVQKSIGVGQ